MKNINLANITGIARLDRKGNKYRLRLEKVGGYTVRYFTTLEDALLFVASLRSAFKERYGKMKTFRLYKNLGGERK
jgi:hypothetical protein